MHVCTAFTKVMEQKLSKLEQVVQSTDIRKKREEYKTKMEKADGRVRTIFNAFDLNGDGTLQLGELRCFLGDGAEDLCREMDEFKLPPPLAVINSCIGVREWCAFFEQLGADVSACVEVVCLLRLLVFARVCVQCVLGWFLFRSSSFIHAFICFVSSMFAS